MLELSNLGLVELNFQEQLEIDGGFWAIFALVVTAICLVAAVINLCS
jgi:hypothetical protein